MQGEYIYQEKTKMQQIIKHSFRKGWRKGEERPDVNAFADFFFSGFHLARCKTRFPGHVDFQEA